jgi:transposase
MIQGNLKRAAAAGLLWPLEAEVTEDILEQRLSVRAGRDLDSAGAPSRIGHSVVLSPATTSTTFR